MTAHPSPGILDAKTAIVTGGGTGVGRGIALALAKEGAAVVLIGRTAASLDRVLGEIEAHGGRAAPAVCDVTSPDDVDASIALTLDRFGSIDILVNNAALVPHGSVLDVPEELVQAAWEAGPLASLRLMRKVHPHMATKGEGAIVNVSSGVTLGQATNRVAYAMVKSALNAASRAAAMEFAADGIRVNTIMPVAMTEPFQRFLDTEPDFAAGIARGIPLGRIGDPESDIGRAVVFLCGPDAKYVTGHTLPLDGGSAYLR